MDQSLRTKTINGVIWTFIEQLSVRGISFIVQIFLARLLFPQDFGLIAMLTIFVSIGEALTDSGITSSLIRKQNLTQNDYSTVFYLNFLVSVFVYFVLFLIAPYVSIFYDQPVLTPVLRAYSLVIILKALIGVQRTILIKEMNFRAIVKIQTPSLILAGIVGIVLARNGYGIWALVYFYLLQNLLATIQFWLYSKWKPILIFDKACLKEHFNFGYKLGLSSIISSFFSDLNNVLIGKFFGVDLLGVYNRAYVMQNLPSFIFSRSLSRITFPLFSKLQDDSKKLRVAYKKVVLNAIFWLCPLFTILFFCSENLFRILLTDKWLAAVPFFKVLCIVGIFFPLQTYNLNVVNAVGRSDLYLKATIIKRIINVVGVLVALKIGIWALVIFEAINSFLAYIINSSFAGKFINYTTYQQILDILPTLFLSIFTGYIAWLNIEFLVSSYIGNDAMILLIYLLTFGLIYYPLSYIFKFSALFDFITTVKSRKF